MNLLDRIKEELSDARRKAPELETHEALWMMHDLFDLRRRLAREHPNVLSYEDDHLLKQTAAVLQMACNDARRRRELLKEVVKTTGA